MPTVAPDHDLRRTAELWAFLAHWFGNGTAVGIGRKPQYEEELTLLLAGGLNAAGQSTGTGTNTVSTSSVFAAVLGGLPAWFRDELHYLEQPLELSKIKGTILPPPAEGERQDSKRRYQLRREIGSGGMGIVYEAVELPAADGKLENRRVAIKAVRRDKVPANTCKKLLNEIKKHQQLKNCGLVEILDAFEENGKPYLVMEHVVGPSLHRLLFHDGGGRPLPTPLVVSVLAQVARCLARMHTHSRGEVIHRDVKPANILLRQEAGALDLPYCWRAVLADVGLATNTDDPPSSDAAAVYGTPGYLAPEQLAGKRPTPKSDVYALGVVAHEMLTGRRYYDPPPNMRHVPAPPVSEQLDGLPPALKPLVGGMLADEPDDRWPLTRVSAELARLSRQSARSGWHAAALGTLGLGVIALGLVAINGLLHQRNGGTPATGDTPPTPPIREPSEFLHDGGKTYRKKGPRVLASAPSTQTGIELAPSPRPVVTAPPPWPVPVEKPPPREPTHLDPPAGFARAHLWLPDPSLGDTWIAVGLGDGTVAAGGLPGTGGVAVEDGKLTAPTGDGGFGLYRLSPAQVERVHVIASADGVDDWVVKPQPNGAAYEYDAGGVVADNKVTLRVFVDRRPPKPQQVTELLRRPRFAATWEYKGDNYLLKETNGPKLGYFGVEVGVKLTKDEIVAPNPATGFEITDLHPQSAARLLVTVEQGGRLLVVNPRWNKNQKTGQAGYFYCPSQGVGFKAPPGATQDYKMLIFVMPTDPKK